jgi:hypothetical protein
VVNWRAVGAGEDSGCVPTRAQLDDGRVVRRAVVLEAVDSSDDPKTAAEFVGY